MTRWAIERERVNGDEMGICQLAVAESENYAAHRHYPILTSTQLARCLCTDARCGSNYLRATLNRTFIAPIAFDSFAEMVQFQIELALSRKARMVRPIPGVST